MGVVFTCDFFVTIYLRERLNVRNSCSRPQRVKMKPNLIKLFQISSTPFRYMIKNIAVIFISICDCSGHWLVSMSDNGENANFLRHDARNGMSYLQLLEMKPSRFFYPYKSETTCVMDWGQETTCEFIIIDTWEASWPRHAKITLFWVNFKHEIKGKMKEITRKCTKFFSETLNKLKFHDFRLSQSTTELTEPYTVLRQYYKSNFRLMKKTTLAVAKDKQLP